MTACSLKPRWRPVAFGPCSTCTVLLLTLAERHTLGLLLSLNKLNWQLLLRFAKHCLALSLTKHGTDSG